MVELYQRYGITGFMFYDDELNVNQEMVSLMRGIREAQEKLGVEWRLRGFAKAELFNEEQATEMFAAGFRWLLIGFESGAPSILTNINKKATRDDNTRCLELAENAGLKVKALMSVGHPGESPETVQATRDWLIETKPGGLRRHDHHDVSRHAVLRRGRAPRVDCRMSGPTPARRPATGCTRTTSTTRASPSTTRAIPTAAITRMCSPTR